MKKYISIAIVAICAFCFASCEKFLDVNSQGAPTQNQFFQNDQQAIDAIDGCYARLPQEAVLGRELYWEQACANDIVWGRTRGYPTLATLSYNGDESPLRGVFERAYKEGMNRCNWVIQQLLLKEQQNMALTAVEKRSLGEAYFMRAYWHFLIAYRYGTKDLGVPFIAYETVEGGYNNEIPPQQPTVMKNYEFIISDLQKAEEILPRVDEYDDANKGRACKESAAALMAKTYAYWATWDATQWPNVITCVDRLENDYGRGLHPVFKELFAPDKTKFFTKEYCWAFPSNGAKDGAGGGSIEFPGVSLENKGWGKFNGWGQFKPSYDIYEEMAKDNVNGVKNERLAASILEYGDVFPYFGEDRVFWSTSDVEAGFQINKFLQAFAPKDPHEAGYVLNNPDWPCTLINWPIIRFADCLLLRAEAYLVAGNVAKATTDINSVRERSHLAPIDGASWQALYHERRCELAFEMAADHAADCKRWAVGGAAEIKALAIAELEAHPRVRHYYGYELKKDADDKVIYPNEYKLDKDGKKIEESNRYYEVSLYKTKDMKPEDIIETYKTFAKVEPYEDYKAPVKVWSNKYMTFPYPSEQINKSAGALQNPPTWN
ncbi:MAG: RagB/SusD family nutrient uptake outer membrane protein [Bacteroidales bacterium]|nr:RagB/SusD family nutrient uptake outer membrane protein [Bacteroidales bacterium]